jgi:hypothetical protein
MFCAMANPFRAKPLTRTRVVLAFTVAVLTDLIQIGLGPLGWTFADEVLDVIAMGITTWLLGFHPLLLPTFIVEFLPLVDMLPTWTGCVGAVVLLRRRSAATSPPAVATTQNPSSESSVRKGTDSTGPVIDV